MPIEYRITLQRVNAIVIGRDGRAAGRSGIDLPPRQISGDAGEAEAHNGACIFSRKSIDSGELQR